MSELERVPARARTEPLYNPDLHHTSRRMKLLALETSADTASVALALGSHTLVRQGGAPGTHARILLGWVSELLAEAECALSHLDGIAFSAGPGSFTGLRLAISVAQGLASGSDLPLVAVPTFEALALAQGKGQYLVCVDARMSEVYSGLLVVDGERIESYPDIRVGKPDLLPRPPGDLSEWSGCGSGFALPAVADLPWIASLAEVRAGAAAHAREVARLGQRQLAAGRITDAALATPLYVRDKVASTTAERLAAGGRA